MDTVYATDGLLDYLGEYARERDPDPVSVSLAVSRASELDLPEMDPETPVFTHFYMPQAGSSVNFVFGVELGTPAGQTQGRFVSHPDGVLEVFESDDLREVVFVGVPPYDRESVAAFGRNGDRKELVSLDVEPDHGELEG
jgi:hypothetical protein